jgi:plasmid stabilization system protein ParE
MLGECRRRPGPRSAPEPGVQQASMAEVVVTAAAEADYLEGLLWYAKRSQRAAEGFETAFEQALEQIASAPLRFAFCDQRH